MWLPLLLLPQGVLETLANQLKQLEEEIKADEAGKQEFERLLAQVIKINQPPLDLLPSAMHG